MIGNVVIPSDVDRDAYVGYAIKTNTICVITDDGDFLKNCPVALNFCGHNDGWFTTMEYPPNEYTLGTQVVMLSLVNQDTPLVVGCLLSRESGTILNEEYQFNLSRKYKADGDDGSITTGSVQIDGRGLKGVLNLLVSSSSADGGKINLSARNTDESGEIKLQTNNLRLYGNKSVNLLSDELVTINVGFVDGSDTVQHKIVIDKESILVQNNEEHKVELTSDEITIEHSDGKKMVVGSNDVKINGGSNGGMVVASDMVSKFNGLVSSFNSLLTQLKVHVHAVSTVGSPVAQTGATTSVIGIIEANASTITAGDIKNDDAQH